MKIALNYCGGCNPAYERNNIVKWLKRDFQNIELSPLKENEKYDLKNFSNNTFILARVDTLDVLHIGLLPVKQIYN